MGACDSDVAGITTRILQIIQLLALWVAPGVRSTP